MYPSINFSTELIFSNISSFDIFLFLISKISKTSDWCWEIYIKDKMGFDEELLSKIQEFSDYISGEQWKKLKKERIEKDNFQCVLCKTKERLLCDINDK